MGSLKFLTLKELRMLSQINFVAERFLLLIFQFKFTTTTTTKKKPIYEPGNIFRCSELIKSFSSNEGLHPWSNMMRLK